MNLRKYLSSSNGRTTVSINKILGRLLFVLLLIQPGSSFAQSDILGKWHCSMPTVDGSKAFMEYDFKSDSLVTISVISETENDFSRYVSDISVDATYKLEEGNLTMHLDTAKVGASVLKYIMINDYETFPEDSINKRLESMARIIFRNYEYLGLKLVTDEYPDVMVFNPLNSESSEELTFYRAVTNKEDLIDLKTDFEIYLEKHFSGHIDVIINLVFYSIVLFIASILIFILKLIFVHTISRVKSSAKNVMVRRIYYYVRFVLKIFIIINLGYFYVSLVSVSICVSKYLAIVAILGGGGLLLYVVSTLSLPVSVITLKNFLKKKKNYVLYLRGFITDDYTPELSTTADAVKDYRPWNNIGVKKAEINYSLYPLSEKVLAKAWKKIAPIYSVGLPEELESPEGAKRIYLDNDTWRDDAFTLMKRAQFIVVNIHSNTNCIWEINQCNMHFSEKTVYFIDDIEKLRLVKEKMGEDFPSCLKSDEIKHNHVAVYCRNDKAIVEPYVNTYLGIRNVVSLIVRTT